MTLLGVGRVSAGVRRVAVAVVVSAAACSSSGGPRTGGLTNWLQLCSDDSDCGGLRCRCGACTVSCGDQENCADLPEAVCVAAADPGAIALCSGSAPPSLGLCLQRCEAGECPPGTHCTAGVCAPVPVPTAQVSIDVARRAQTLVGIGAGLGYVTDEIVQHPRKTALLDAMFSGTGLTLLRLRNRYGQEGEELASTSEIVAAAAARLGRSPTLILNSASPPGALKANGSNWCEGNPQDCTLSVLEDGSFDYAGFAAHWRESLEAHAIAGISPDYVSVQNNPNWVPAAGDGNEACRFLPTEGSITVATDAGELDVRYPGYDQALAAVVEQLAGLGAVPRILAPETTGHAEVGEYVAALDLALVDGIAHHLYGTGLDNLDLDALAALGELGRERQRPVFLSEMHAEPLTTAVLLHSVFVVEGAVTYVHNGFVGSAAAREPDRSAIVTLTREDFQLGDNYHVLGQYSAHLGPDWIRVAADVDRAELLASAWVSPEDDVLVVILTNPGPTGIVAQLMGTERAATGSTMVRTVLGGLERSAELGELTAEGVVEVPGQGIVTITLRR